MVVADPDPDPVATEPSGWSGLVGVGCETDPRHARAMRVK